MTFIPPKDRVMETSATSGSGPWTLAGAVDASFNAFSASMADGDTTIGGVIEPGVAFASGILTWNSSGPTITLSTTFESKGAFSTGSKQLFMGLPSSSTVIADKLAPGQASNYSISVSAASNNLTITINDAGGNTPSAGSPILAAFRSSTLTNGASVSRRSASALTFTINSTNTMGTASNQPFKLHLVLFDNAGTLVLGAICALVGGASPTAITPIDISNLQASQSGTNGGSTAGLYYAATSALSSKAIAYLGYLECNSTSFTAGSWGTSTTGLISRIVKAYPGMPMPGSIVQKVQKNTSASDQTTSGTFVKMTTQLLSITPTCISNLIQADASISVDSGATGIVVTAQWGRGTTNNSGLFGGQGAADGATSGGRLIIACLIRGWDLPNTTSSQTYQLQAKNSDSATTVGVGSAALTSQLELLEYAT